MQRIMIGSIALAASLTGAAQAQNLLPVAGKSIVFTISGDAQPYVLYVSPQGKAFFAMAFGQLPNCPIRGRYGLNGQIGRTQNTGFQLRAGECTVRASGRSTTTFNGSTLGFQFNGAISVSMRGVGAVQLPLSNRISIDVNGAACTVRDAAANLGGNARQLQATACAVRPGNLIGRI